MLKIYTLQCERCHREYEARFNLSAMAEMDYELTMQKALGGDFGMEIAETVKKHPEYVISCEPFLYYCQNCGNWHSDYQLSLYEPVNENIRYHYDSLNENDEFKLVGKYEHVCEKCGSMMEEHDEYSFRKMDLKCPCCKGHLVDDSMMYD